MLVYFLNIDGDNLFAMLGLGFRSLIPYGFYVHLPVLAIITCNNVSTDLYCNSSCDI